MAPISMSGARKCRPSKANGAPEYVPSTAYEFPLGAPATKKGTSKADQKSATSENSCEAIVEKRKSKDDGSVNDGLSKRRKMAAGSADITAYESPNQKRKVEIMTGTIDDLSVKPSKMLKVPKVPTLPEAGNTSSKKRPASTPVFPDGISAQRFKTGSENVDDDLVMDDVPLDRDEPISLERLAEAEEAAKAAGSTATLRTKSSYPSPADSPLPARSANVSTSRKVGTKQKAPADPGVNSKSKKAQTVLAHDLAASHAPSIKASAQEKDSPEAEITADQVVNSPKTSVSDKDEAEVTEDPLPVHNPGACFTHAMPSALSPWPHKCPAPTPHLDQPLSVSPVNWDNMKGVTDAQKEAYDMRAPWNSKPATFGMVAKQTAFKLNGKNISEEGIRKRFKAASLAIFRTSGVYFEGSGLGLDAFGVPKKNSNLKALIEQASLPVTTAAATSSSANTSSTAPTPSLDCTSATASAPFLQHLPQPASHKDNGPSGDCMADNHINSNIYEGEIIIVRLNPTSKEIHFRYCDAELISNYASLMGWKGSPLSRRRTPLLLELPFSPKAFDRWHTAVCFGLRSKFPAHEVVCQEVGRDSYLLCERMRDLADERPAIRLMIETYLLSNLFGSEASEMLFAEIVDRMKKREGMEYTLDKKYAKLYKYMANDDRLMRLFDLEKGMDDQELDDEEEASEPCKVPSKNDPTAHQKPLEPFKDGSKAHRKPFFEPFKDAENAHQNLFKPSRYFSHAYQAFVSDELL